MTAPTVGQDKPVNIMLTSASSTPAAYLLENLPKDGCSNVSIVQDASQADFTLEAQGGDFEGAKGSEGPHGPRPARAKAKYTLFKNGRLFSEPRQSRKKARSKTCVSTFNTVRQNEPR
jgi:hypothetical protein